MLRVIVLDDSLPFASCTPDFSGVAVDLWKDVAAHHGWTYTLHKGTRSFDETLRRVQRGEFDVALGDFSVIARRFSWVDYSRPFYVAGLKIMRSSRKTSSVYLALDNSILPHLLVLSVVLIIVFAVVHRVIAKPSGGLSYSVYHQTMKFFVSASEEPIEGKAPQQKAVAHTPWLKVFNVLWVLCVFIVINLIVAQVVSLYLKERNYIDDSELKRLNSVSVLAGSSFVDFAKKYGKRPIERATLKSLIDAMKASGDEYVFDDPSVIAMYIQRNNIKLDLHTTSKPLVNDEYVIAFRKELDDTIMQKFNHKLVELQDRGDMLNYCRRYFVEDIDRCVL